MNNNANQIEEISKTNIPPQYPNISQNNNGGFINDDNLDSTNKILSVCPYFLSITVYGHYPRSYRFYIKKLPLLFLGQGF